MESDNNFILNAAYDYAARGWVVTPIHLGTKRPYLSGYTTRPLARDEFYKHFNNNKNIGVVLGRLSNKADIDFDCDEAARLGPQVFPPTDAIFGRKSRPQSHRFYSVINPGPRKVFKDAILEAQRKQGDDDKAMIVEYRGDGCQTMAPPSLHPTLGEGRLKWMKPGAAPASVTRDELLKCCAKLAIMVMRERYSDKQIAALPQAAANLEEWHAILEGREPVFVVNLSDNSALRHEKKTPCAPRSKELKVFRELNDHALGRLASWIPSLNLARMMPFSGGYKAVASWRPSSTGRPIEKRNRNLSIVSEGIVDFGADQTYTPLDLVIAAKNYNLKEAFDHLKDKTGFTGAWPKPQRFEEARPESVETISSRVVSDIVIVATSVEEARIVASATGYEARVSHDDGKVKPEPGKTFVYLNDFTVKSNPSRAKKMRDYLRTCRREGLVVIEAAPYPDKRDERTFVDLYREQDAEAVLKRINLYALDMGPIASPYAQINSVRDNVDKCISGVIDEFADYNPEENCPPVYGVKLTVGGGKSDAVLRHIARKLLQMRAAGDTRVFVYQVPYNRLGDNLIKRFNEIAGGKLKANIWRGRESSKLNARDTDDKMCERIDDVRLAQKLRVKIGDEICPKCPMRDSCAYMKQRGQEGSLWFVAHPIVFGRVPATIGAANIAAIVVDESPWQSGIISGASIPLSLLTSEAMPVPDGDGPLGGSRLADIRWQLSKAATANGLGPMRAQSIKDQYLSQESASDALKMEAYRIVTTGPWRERKQNKTVGPMMMIWRAIKEMLVRGAEATGRLYVEQDEETQALVLRVSGRLSVHDDWRKPTILIDANLEPGLLRHYWPSITVKGSYAVDAPHMRVHQVLGRTFSKAMLAPLKGESVTENGKEPAKERSVARSKIKTFIVTTARRVGGKCLVIGNLDVIKALELPDHISTAHFNALAGLNDFGDVRALIVIGRTQPRPEAVEQMSEALTGRVVDHLPGWYALHDVIRYVREGDGIVPVLGETVGHPDSTAEMIRYRICEGEVEQAIGRGRGISRTASNPLDVFILSDVALSLPVNSFIDEDDVLRPSAFDMMLAIGGIAFTDGASASRFYPELWKAERTARDALANLSNCGGLPKDNISYGVPPQFGETGRTQTSAGLIPITFKRAGRGNSWLEAFYDPVCLSDPRSALEAKLGSLAGFIVPPPKVDTQSATVNVGLPVIEQPDALPPYPPTPYNDDSEFKDIS